MRALKSAIFLCGLLMGAAQALADPVPDYKAEEAALKDFSQSCPSSAEGLAAWVERKGAWQARLLSPADLTGDLAFLNAPYPERSDVVVGENFLKQFPLGMDVAAISQILGAYVAPGNTRRSNYDEYPWSLKNMFMGMISSREHSSAALRQEPIDVENVYRFAIDEGCGNITVFQVGVWSLNGKTYEVNVRRLYDDYDFARRGLPYRFINFDQEMPYEIQQKVHMRALQSLLNQARKNGQGDFPFMYNLLRNAGLTTTHLNVKQEGKGRWNRVWFYYVPPYVKFKPQFFNPWDVVITFKEDGYTIDNIYVGYPNCHCIS